MRQYPWVVVGIAAVGVAFGLVSVLVFLSRGQSPVLIKAKLRAGALLLTLQALIAGQVGPACATCYEPMLDDEMVVTRPEPANGELTVDLAKAEAQVWGGIYNRKTTDFSLALRDEACAQQADAGGGDAANGTACVVDVRRAIVAQDGAMDEASEDFVIELDPDLADGRYQLSLFNKGVDQQDAASPRAEYTVIVSRNNQ